MGERVHLTRSTGYHSRCDFRRAGVQQAARVFYGSPLHSRLEKTHSLENGEVTLQERPFEPRDNPTERGWFSFRGNFNNFHSILILIRKSIASSHG